MTSIRNIIDRYKHMRSINQLRQVPIGQYAFVGFGNHSTSNLYPVLDYLHVPLKYICCKSEDKAQLIKTAYPHIHVTLSLQELLDDEEVKGVFVAVSPQEHFQIASAVLKSGKAKFIEKPPCQNMDELMKLVNISRSTKVSSVVGLQKRQAPVIRILKKELGKCKRVMTYNLKYLTGAYPEGDALMDLYIHPLDYVTYLFGKAVVKCVEKVENHTLMLLLKHNNATGVLELSTGYSWTEAKELLTINTSNGIYQMEQMDSLKYQAKQRVVMGIPMEKISPRNMVVIDLFGRNNFVPMIQNNQIYTQGYFDTIKHFVNMVECGKASQVQSFANFVETYSLLESIRSLVKQL